MPFSEAHLRRWQVGSIWLLFLVLAIVYIIGLWKLTNEQHAIVSVRSQQIVELRQTAIRSCRSRHLLAKIAITRSQLSIKQLQIAERGPTADLPGARAIFRASVVLNRRLLVLARRADCRGVPHLPAIHLK